MCRHLRKFVDVCPVILLICFPLSEQCRVSQESVRRQYLNSAESAKKASDAVPDQCRVSQEGVRRQYLNSAESAKKASDDST